MINSYFTISIGRVSNLFPLATRFDQIYNESILQEWCKIQIHNCILHKCNFKYHDEFKNVPRYVHRELFIYF